MPNNVITKASKDYQKLIALLSEVDAEATATLSLDDEISKLDIVDILDGDDDKFNLADLNAEAFKRNARLFGDIETVLDKDENGWMTVYYNLPYEDRQRVAGTFCKTGTANPASLALDKNFLAEALGMDGRAARFVQREMFETHEYLAYNAVWSSPAALEFIPHEMLLADPNIAGVAVRHDPLALEFVPAELQIAEPSLVHLALMQDPAAFAFVAPDFQIAHPEIVTAMIGILGDAAMVDIAPEFWSENGYVMSIDWEGLREAPLNIDDPESLLAWLTADGMNLQYVPDDAQASSPETVFAALLQNPEALQFTSEAFQKDNPALVQSTLALIQNAPLFYVTKGYQETAGVEELRELLARDPMGLPYLSLKLARLAPADYYACFKTALTYDGAALQFVPQSYLQAHPELTTTALESNALALEFTTVQWQIAHPTAVLKAVLDNAEAAKFIKPEFQAHHPKTTLKAFSAAIERDPFTIGLTPPSFQLANPDLVYKAVFTLATQGKSAYREGDSILYHISDEFLMAHTGILMRVINYDHRNMTALVAAINDHTAGESGEHAVFVEMIASMYVNGDSAIPYFFAMAIQGNMGVLKPILDLDADILAKTWAYVQQQAQADGLTFPVSVNEPDFGECVTDDAMESPQAFQDFLDQHTEFPERFHSLKTVHEIFIAGEKKNDPRPVALLLVTKNDWNGAFENAAVTEGLVDDGRFRVVYREIDSDDDITSALKQFGPVHTLVLAGHGSKTTLQLGPDGSTNDEHVVDTGDLDDCDEEKQSYFVPGGNILLWACSNGEGGNEYDNLHRALAWSYPGMSIMSAPMPKNIARLWFDADKTLHTELDDGVNPVSSAPTL